MKKSTKKPVGLRLSDPILYLVEKEAQEKGKNFTDTLEDILLEYFDYDNFEYLKIDYEIEKKYRTSFNVVAEKTSGGGYNVNKCAWHWPHRCLYAVSLTGKCLYPVSKPLQDGIEFEHKDRIFYNVIASKIKKNYHAPTKDALEKEIRRWS